MFLFGWLILKKDFLIAHCHLLTIWLPWWWFSTWMMLVLSHFSPRLWNFKCWKCRAWNFRRTWCIFSFSSVCVICSYHPSLPSRIGFLILIFRGLTYYCASETKQIYCRATLPMLNIEDIYRDMGSVLVTLIQSFWIMEFWKVKEAVCWVMKNHLGTWGGHVWDGVVSTILNILKLVHQMLILTNVRLLSTLLLLVIVPFQ